MKNFPHINYAQPSRPNRARLFLHLLVALLLVLVPSLIARGQKSDGNVTVSNVTSHPTSTGTVVTIAADGSLNRAQTWQDKEGFHVSIPDAGLSDLVKSGRGVRVRRVGSAIEILLQAKQGTSVSVQSTDNYLSLIVDGKLDQAGTTYDQPTSQESSQQQAPSYVPSSDYSSSQSYSPSTYSSGSSYPAETTSSSAPSSASSQPQTAPANGDGQVRQAGEYQSHEEGNVPEVQAEDEGILASVFSGTSVAVVLVLAVVALLVVRKFRVKGDTVVVESTNEEPSQENVGEIEEFFNESAKSKESTAMVRSGRNLPANGGSREGKPAVRPTVAAAPASLFGAYRIDQEVGKLVLGQPHRMDVLSSRATDDRRAIEASLIKAVVSVDSGEDERRRAREALTEYGFVARQSATLLLATDPFERTSAARSLGEIGSAAALPFLLEALYDSETIVRNQAVVSIGELKVPSAIGALLDMARKHPDVPASLVSKALSACSVEGLGFFDAVIPATSFLTTGTPELVSLEITQLEQPLTTEELPESSPDEVFVEALEKVSSEDVEERSDAVKTLAQFAVQQSVSKLVAVARQDSEANVRALAVSSLAFIDHESVFPSVLIGMADESREVRAAAARVMSRLSFERSDAYFYLLQTGDEEMISLVAEACIKAGIVSQNIDRLSSSDRRQAYETFTLICLLAKAQHANPILDAIAGHSNMNVRLSAIHLLATTGESYLFEEFQKLADRETIEEEIKTALLEGMYKLEQAKPAEETPVDEFVIRENQDEFESHQYVEESNPGFDFTLGTQVDEVEL